MHLLVGDDVSCRRLLAGGCVAVVAVSCFVFCRFSLFMAGLMMSW
jgi:hypothetical protein